MPQIIWKYWLTASDDGICRSCVARNGLLYRQSEGPPPHGPSVLWLPQPPVRKPNPEEEGA